MKIYLFVLLEGAILLLAASADPEGTCGPLKSLITEEELCHTDSTSTTCQNYFPVDTVVTKRCKSVFSSNSANATYLCSKSGWISKPCQSECGLKNAGPALSIASGKSANESEYPWAIAIFNGGKRWCIGTLISPYHVITVAHCFTNITGGLTDTRNYTVAAGKYYADLNIIEPTLQTREIKSRTVHPHYYGIDLNYANDIAILEVNEPFQLSLAVLPICVDWNSTYEGSDLADGNKGEMVGWGFTAVEANRSAALEKLTVSFEDPASCMQSLPEDFSYQYFTKDKFCTRNYVDRNSTKCVGYSGAGLYYKSDTKRYFLRGILSLEPKMFTCQMSKYQLHTRVLHYLDWIRGVIDKNEDFNFDFVTKRDYNFVDGCLLPDHPKYGKFSTTSKEPYIVNKLVASPSIISLSYDDSCKDVSSSFLCKNKEWQPPIETIKCKDPDRCGPLKSLLTEEELCYTNSTSTACQGYFPYGTVIIKRCKGAYSSSSENTAYRCSKTGWILNSKPCQSECGLKTTAPIPLIAGGEPANENEYPWTIAIYEDSPNPICSGTLISPYHVLTVAHCVSETQGGVKDTSNYTIAAGKYYADINTIEATLQTRKIKTVAVHPYFHGNLLNYANDIAVLEVNEPFQLSSAVLPICIDWNSTYEGSDFRNGNKGEMTGWGFTSIETKQSHVLKKLNVPFRDIASCTQSLPDDFRSKYVTKDKFCAGYYQSETSACAGDSGAGLYYKSDRKRYFLRGILSVGPKGFSCQSNYYQLYTRVSDHLDWIRSEIEKNEDIKFDFVTKVDNNFANGCLLPDHVQYGRFGTLNGEPYIANKLVASSSIISLTCYDNVKDVSSFFYCENKKWQPSIDTAKCRKPGTCPSIKTSISEDVLCKLNEGPVNCDEPPNGTIAIVRCQPYYSFQEHRPIYKCENGTWDQTFVPCNPECGAKRESTETLIVDGEDAVVNEYPWIAAVYNGTKHQICAATIISRWFVVSAAHCFTTKTGQAKSKDDFLIGAGKYYRDINVNESSAQIRKIKTLFIHEDYKGKLQKYRDDIALIELNETLVISLEVEPACIDWGNIYEDFDFIDGKEGVIVGWGNTQEGTSPSDVLKKLALPYRARHVCLKDLPRDYAQEFLSSDKICAGYLNKSMGPCSGDSGGGLYFRSTNGNKFYIRGIISITVKGSVGCDANHYTLFTKFSKYVSWIETKTRRIL